MRTKSPASRLLVCTVALALSATGIGPGLAQSPTRPDPRDDGAEPPAVQALHQRCVRLSGELYRYRRLKLLQVPAIEILTPDSYAAYADRMLEDQYGKDLDKEQELLTVLGMLPQGLDLKQLIRKHMSRLALAVYDYRTKAIMAPAAGAADESLFHELVHADTDGHFDLAGMITRAERRDDWILAAGAVIEGDAIRTSTNRQLGALRFPVRFVPYRVLVAVLDQRYAGAVPNLERAFPDVPRTLMEAQLFPYLRGWTFMEYVSRRGGWGAVNDAYRNPPRTTEEVLHPEKYFQLKPDWQEVVPGLEPPAGWKVGFSNVFGEFGLGLWLGTRLSRVECGRASAGWGGDRLWLLTDADGSAAAVGCSLWDTPADADEFEQAANRWSQSAGGKPGLKARVVRLDLEVRWAVAADEKKLEALAGWMATARLATRQPQPHPPVVDFRRQETPAPPQQKN